MFNKAIIFVVLTVAMHVSIIQCMEQIEVLLKRQRAEQIKISDRSPELKVLGGWTGLAAGSFVGKKVFNNLARAYPTNLPESAMKKEQYLKYARYSRNVSRIAALPGMGLVILAITAVACVRSSEYISISHNPLFFVGILSSVPHVIMVNTPVRAYLKKQS